MTNKYDVAVIGGGPAGYVAAIRAAQLGGKVVLFERSVLGGTCLNRGCVPTKTYLKTAEEMDVIRHAGDRGICNESKVSINMVKAVAYKNKVVKKLTDGVGGLLASYAITVVYGSAVLLSEKEIGCEEKKYQADKLILCGGSMATKVPIEGANHKRVLYSDDILDMTECPGRLVIIGGGVIGCEMADVFRGFGSKVTIVEAMDNIVPNLDKEVSAGLKRSLSQKGIDIMTSQMVDKIEHFTDVSRVICKNGSALEADKILICIGRSADLSLLGDLKDKIVLEGGKIVVDQSMRTNIGHIYAPGDLNGLCMLAHAAFKMGETAAENAMGHTAICDLTFVPSCIYTSPEAAFVGLTQEEAVEKYGRKSICIGKYQFGANGRALASGKGDGFMKVIVNKEFHEIVGVHILGGEAAEIINEAACLMQMEVTADEIAKAIHAHPTYSEVFMEACADAIGTCIHLPPVKKK